MKHILCDIDGVVINGYHVDPSKRVSWSANLEKDFGIKQSDMESVFFHGPFVQVMEGKVALIEAIESVSEKLGYNGDAQTLIDYWFEKDSRCFVYHRRQGRTYCGHRSQKVRSACSSTDKF